MKGIRCEQVGRLALTDLEQPRPRAGEALIRIRRVGICGTDLHAFRGMQPYFTYPRILGHELAGIIEELDEDAGGFRVGDQVSIIPYLACGGCIACRGGKPNCCASLQVLGVHADGGMRERICVPVGNLIGTSGLTLDQSAVIEPLAIGAHAVRRAELQTGETVLVIGAGPIGLGVMTAARQAGVRVIAMDVQEERLAFCRDWLDGVETLNAGRQPLAQLADRTGGDYAAVVFDATGNARSMEGAFDYVAHGGKLVYVGLVRADISFHDPDFHRKEMTLLGSRNATAEDFRAVIEWLRRGVIDTDRYITHRCALEDTVDRFPGWLSPEAGVIKAMIEL